MKYYLILIISICLLSINLKAQKKISSINKIINIIPDSSTTTTQNIADYINLNIDSNEDKLRAIFIWIAENIQYDVDNMFDYGISNDGIIQKTLKSKKGVCLNYSSLFNDLASKVGVDTYLILGYTKQQGKVYYEPHSWCAANLDSTWYLFDPTWGAGTVNHTKFTKKIDHRYFKLKPIDAIKTHMPFDPLWQFLFHPINHPTFCNSKLNKKSEYFNFQDSLNNYENQTYIERIYASKNRIESNIINSFLLYTQIEKLTQIADIYYENNVTDKYDNALNYYQYGLLKLNTYIDTRNNKFSAFNNDSEIKQMLDSVNHYFDISLEQLNKIEQPYKKHKNSIANLYESIDMAKTNLAEQKIFLDKYLNTYKNYRKSLFYDKM